MHWGVKKFYGSQVPNDVGTPLLQWPTSCIRGHPRQQDTRILVPVPGYSLLPIIACNVMEFSSLKLSRFLFKAATTSCGN